MSWLSARRWLWGLLALLGLTVIGLLIWNAARRPVDAVWERIQREGVWRVAIDPSFPPFESLDAKGRPVGFDVDLAEAIAGRWGVEVAFQGIGFDGLIAALWADRADSVISAISVDPRLTRDVAYSIPYFEAGLLLVVAGRGSSIERLEDLAGRRLAVEWGSEGDVQGRELRRRLAGLDLSPHPDARAALQSVLAGDADAALAEAVTYLQVRQEQRGLHAVGDPIVSVPYVIAIQQEAPLLLQAINDALIELEGEGMLQDIQDKWLGG